MTSLTFRTLVLAAMTGLSLVTTGCAVVRGQESMGTYIDDRSITASVKTKLIEDKTTSAATIEVDTQEGVVTLSGFAKTAAEKAQAEALARSAKGVKSVRNNITVRP